MVSEQQKKSFMKEIIDIGWASSIGLFLVLSTLIGLITGIYLDKWFNTKPYFTLIFLIFGIIAGFWNILKGIFRKRQ